VHRLAVLLSIFFSTPALLLGGCSATVGLQTDGTYALESSEQHLDCQRLANSVWDRLQLLKSLPKKAEAERQDAAPTAVAVFGRLFGANKGLAALAEYDRERAHVRSLHQTMMEKGCAPYDVERELAATDAAISEFRKP
jgi:hypothetical protein